MTSDSLRTESLLIGVPGPKTLYEHTVDSILTKHQRLLELGATGILELMDGEPAKPTVSSFANWVIRQQGIAKIPTRLQSGKAAEQYIAEYYEKVAREKRAIPQWLASDWQLVHSGLGDEYVEPYRISSLAVGGHAMCGVPDLVYRHRASGKILIVEIKVSNAKLHADGWPNLRAQLWAYSKIDLWAHAPETILAGEIWTPIVLGPVRRTTYRWLAGDTNLESECSRLFCAFGGEVVELTQHRHSEA